MVLMLAVWLLARQPGRLTDQRPAEVVVVSWGGLYQAAQREAFWKPFQEETGIKVIEDESPEHSRLKAQVDSGNPEWDVVSTAVTALFELGPDYFVPIAYDRYPDAYADIPEDMKLERTVVGMTYCYAVVYRTDVFRGEHVPRNWADFWNVKKFPGPRGMALDGGVPWSSVEAAWLAAGNDPSTLEQGIDLDVVFEQFDRLRPSISKWWRSGGEALQLLASKEVVMGIAPTGEIPDMIAQGVPVVVSWKQALCGYNNWYILKGSRNVEAAQQLLAYMQDSQRQAEFVKRVPIGVPNPNAYNYLDPQIARMLPTHPENIQEIIIQGEGRSRWWARNREKIVHRFNEWSLKRGG